MRHRNNAGFLTPAFIGRKRERLALIEALGRNGGTVEIVGMGGVGKTAFLQHFEKTTDRIFRGGVEWFSGSPHFQLSEAISPIADKFRAAPGRHLLFVDNADQLNKRDLVETINRLSTGSWPFATVLAGRRPLEIGHIVIELSGLSYAEFEALARHLFHDALDAPNLQHLHEVTGGLPLVARLLHATWLHGRTAPGDLGNLLTPFEQPGLVDLAGRPLASESAASQKIIADVRVVNDDFLRRASDDPDFVFNISPRQFEVLVAELLSRQGYKVELTQETRDGGKDIYAARRDDLGTFLYIIECKRYAPNRPVGVEVVRALHGVTELERVSGAMVITTSYFSRDAREFEEQIRYRMSLKEYLDLRHWLAQLRPQ